MFRISEFLVVLVACYLLPEGSGHIRIREPPGRSSVWRDARFKDSSPIENQADDAIYCGTVPQLELPENCGVCGDPTTDPQPRPNESGGTYGKGIIVGKYKAGEDIKISVELNVPHGGFFKIRLCDELPETDKCFAKYPSLFITYAPGKTAMHVPVEGDEPRWFNGTVKLPPAIKCEHCVLRLNYRGGSNIGKCDDGKEAAGCGAQLNFRNCVDISIS